MKINEEDIKVLKFKDELVNLLNKYNYDIVGSDIDSIYIDTNNGIYNLTDDKCICRTDAEGGIDYFKDKNIMEELIKHYFKNNRARDFCSGNHGNCRCGIITNNREKALKILHNIKDKHEDSIRTFYSNPINAELRLTNGDIYLWVNSATSARGHRFHELYIDKNVSYEFFVYILPIIGQYCVSENIHII